MVCYRSFLASLTALFLFSAAPASAFNTNITAGSITLGSGNLTIGESPGSELVIEQEDSDGTYQHQIFVDGDLYLDFSLFGEGDGMINAPGDIRFSAMGTLWIGGFEDGAVLPDMNALMILTTPPFSLNTTGDLLLFSESGISSGSFEATGSLYVGNYSSLASVPLPGSFVFLFSGLVWISRKASGRTGAA